VTNKGLVNSTLLTLYLYLNSDINFIKSASNELRMKAYNYCR
jgi:hypothetical protein